MIIQPAVEVNAVVDASSSQANRWGSDSRQQGFADAEIGSSRRTIQTADGEGIGYSWPFMRVHNRNLKSQSTQHAGEVDHNCTGRSADLTFWRRIIEHEKLWLADRDVPNGQAFTPGHGYVDRFATLYGE